MPKTIPRESKEIISLLVTNSGTVITDYEVALVLVDTRPVAFAAPDVSGAKRGVLIEDLLPGIYQIYVRKQASPEIPVTLVDYIVVT